MTITLKANFLQDILLDEFEVEGNLRGLSTTHQGRQAGKGE